jgi:sec-independent protein translocase protein TatA
MPANLRGWEILVIALLILLLFGAKRLPDAARGLGRSLRIFKAETKGLAEDVKSGEAIEAVQITEELESSPAPDPAQRPER